VSLLIREVLVYIYKSQAKVYNSNVIIVNDNINNNQLCVIASNSVDIH